MMKDMADEASAVAATSSPKNRVKLLCSYGGKIMPRAVDGHLKYVGGETRVIAIPRDINFSELKKKLSVEFEGDMVLKYQVIPEELDVLVSVRTNEDLKHMLDEYDRHESEGAPKLRAFLFPSNPAAVEKSTPMDPSAPEQRSVDAVNGMVRTTANCRLSPINANHPSFSLSASSSPKSTSPESNTADSVPHEPTFMNSYHVSRNPMTRVHSSPSLCNLNTAHHHSNNLNNHHLYQHQHQHQHHPQHLYHPHHQQHNPHGYQPSRSPHDPHRLSPSLPLGRPDFGRAPTGSGLNQYYSSRHNLGSGNSSKYGHYDDYSSYGLSTADRSISLPQSPSNGNVE
ncbi:hypothetical protein NC652_012182 [Populus alba x Populus x berolinensis]|uniref:PB1 domain-containing protein n=1 Tax=Populus tomentosa TaxID=118781 RepID=A0A8X8A4U2_POPTO|nr:hypothetical protein POTOM_016424 [Populus tomentosa]KAJ6937804.1 hypothetical protein NC652_012182 [Populus alba x Populus x berolinensis]